MLGFPNRIDQSTLSGGAWVATLPLANLQVRTLGKVARSNGLALPSTQFKIDLGRSTKSRLISLRRHNVSQEARYRITASMDAALSSLEYDSGWRDVWPVMYEFGELEWEDDNWWTGKYNDEELNGYTTELVHILPEDFVSRYWRIEISDPNNPAGYVEFGRVFIGPAWQPQVNMIYGASVGWETDTAATASRSGAEYFDVRTPNRVQHFTLDFMAQDEAFGRAFELQRQAGIHSEILFIHDPDDTVHALRRQFSSRLRALSAIEYPSFNLNGTAFELKELL
jgi:hypothetical protein